VLRGVSLSIARGEMVALMGASGSGKTTLMNILGCLDRPSAGRYWFDGREMSGLSPNARALVRTEKIGFVFQSFNLLPRTTALHNVLMPLDYARGRPAPADARGLAEGLLDRIGLADRLHHDPAQMSGGQQQRVAIARALVNRPVLVLADEPTGNLDSHTSVEILQMFRQLNAAGITVILVTHDPKVAAYARRTIHIRDGQIENDEAATGRLESVNRQPTADAPVGPAAFSGAVAPKARGAGLSAFLPRTVGTAFTALRRNKLRSALTALGVIIGVAAVIAMVEIGEGSKIAIEKTIASMGANTIMIHAGAVTRGGVTQGGGSAVTLTPYDGEEIVRQCPAVLAVAPLVRARGQIIYGNRNWIPLQICGTTPSFLPVRDWHEFIEGDMFTEDDVRSGAQVCVIGDTLRRELFEDEPAAGKEIRVQNVTFRVVGVLSRKGANTMGVDQDDILVAPWTTVQNRIGGVTTANAAANAAAASDRTATAVNTLSNLYPGSTPLYSARSASQLANTPQMTRFASVDHMYAKAASAEEIPQALEQITALLRERHRIPLGEPDDFRVNDMAEASKAMASTSQLMTSLLLAVALISLVVGGVGIMNIMLVSVTERTREIGLRMAVGARNHHILRQFLTEAVALCLVGGAVGILLGRGVSLLVRSVMRWPTEPALYAIVAAAAVSATVGIIFGFYPAWKASRLDPIEALRYE
jgi:macrolide transport system ATP-binding/permease protein